MTLPSAIIFVRVAPPCSLGTISQDLRAPGAARTLTERLPTLWRYRDVLPISEGAAPVTLGEGFTPLIRARRLEQELGADAVYIKDESLNPTNSFKARGLSVAVTRARDLGARTLSVPSAGNAGNALAAYAAQAGTIGRGVHATGCKGRPLFESVSSTVHT